MCSQETHNCIIALYSMFTGMCLCRLSRFYLGGPTSIRGFSMYSMGPQSEGETLTWLSFFRNMLKFDGLLKGCVLELLIWQATTLGERVTGLEASTCTPLYPSGREREALATSSGHTSSSTLETFVTSTMVSSWKQNEHQCFMHQTLT